MNGERMQTERLIVPSNARPDPQPWDWAALVASLAAAQGVQLSATHAAAAGRALEHLAVRTGWTVPPEGCHA